VRVWAGALALTIAVTACAHPAADPQTLADDTTRGVYNVDLDATSTHFDDALKGQVTRGTIGQLSDEMHALGAYHGLKPATSDPDKGRYDFQAAFDKGTLLVQLRLDPDGKIGAYRIAPQTTTTQSR
jgi:hypothetical protein